MTARISQDEFSSRAAEIAREHGYALAVHGTLGRDMDLGCIPWTQEARDPEIVVKAITTKYYLRTVDYRPAELKDHGRRVYTITVGFGECFIDLSFMPRLYE
jgi:hypothetical protein